MSDPFLRLTQAELALQANVALRLPTPMETARAILDELNVAKLTMGGLNAEVEGLEADVEMLENSRILLRAEFRGQVERAERAEAFAVALSRLLLLMVRGDPQAGGFHQPDPVCEHANGPLPEAGEPVAYCGTCGLSSNYWKVTP